MSDLSRMQNIHATCVSFEGKGSLIVGASGSGKSALALELMALGADLVSDDRTNLRADKHHLLATAPENIRGLIEARGMGILRAETTGLAKIILVVDLNRTETERLPQRRWTNYCGLRRPLIHRIDAPYFPAAILQYLKAGKVETS